MASSATHEMRPSGTRHQLAEVVEQVAGVVGPRPGLGMVLDRKGRFVAEGEALDRVVVEVHMRELHRAVAGIRPQPRRQRPARSVRRLEAEGLGGDGEAMVLRGDLDPTVGEAGDRMVRAVVAESEFERRQAERQAQKLVAEADPEDGHLAEELPDGGDAVADCLGIAGPVGEEDPVGPPGEQLRRRRRRRVDRDGTPVGRELAQDVRLHAEVVGGDPEPGAVAGPFVGLAGGDLGDEIRADHRRVVPEALDDRGRVGAGRGDGPPHRPCRAEVAREAAGVDLGDRGDAPLPEVVVQALLASPRRPRYGQVADDEAGDVGPGAFGVDAVEPVVADVGIGHRDDLAAVRRVGEDLLVPGHPGVEDHLPGRERPLGAEAGPLERRTVLQHQQGVPLPTPGGTRPHARTPRGEPTWPSRATTRPWNTVRRTRPVSSLPSQGQLRERLANLWGSTVHRAAGSKTTRFAHAPATTGPPWPSRPRIRAGAVDIRRTMSPSVSRPVATRPPIITPSAVSSPINPGGAASNSASFSWAACGAWSVAMLSIVPSARAARSASTSFAERSGGLTLKLVS